MAQKVVSWSAARTRLAFIKETCEALQRGDQPDKVKDLKPADLEELFMNAKAIVDFCSRSLEQRVATGQPPVEHLPEWYRSTYVHARQYGRSVACLILLRYRPKKELKTLLKQWLEKERTLPQIEIVYS